MNRYILKSTTAVALGFAMSLPTAILAANAAPGFLPGAFQVAQADTTSKNGKAKGRDKKAGDVELCEDGTEPLKDVTEASKDGTEPAKDGTEPATDGTEPAKDGTEQPCIEDAKTDDSADKAVSEETKASEAPGQKKKVEKDTETQVEEQKAEEATTTAPVEVAPAESVAKEEVATPKAEEAAPATATETSDAKPGKKKKNDKGQAESESATAPAAATETPATEAAQPATETVAPSDDAKTVEELKPAETKPRKVKKAETDPKVDIEAASAAESDDKPATTAEEKPPAAAAAATEEGGAAPVEVTSETVTEETTRTSDEEVPVAQSGDSKKKSNDLVKILGAAAGGVVVGAILNEVLGGGKVVESTGDRVIIERDGEYYVRKDENEFMRRPGSNVRTETFGDGSSRTVVERENGVRVVTIRDADGYIVRRSRILPDGNEILLFDDTEDTRVARDSRRVRIEEDQYPRYDSSVRQRQYIDYSAADRDRLHDVLLTGPIASFDRRYSLRQVRENERLRDAMPRLDLDVITFETGSAAITPSQARKLDPLGWAMQDILRDNPDEVFLIEGHTDAVGSRFSNLILSDRRAEAVALALTEYYDIAPENLITQGYGEEYLKIETERAERSNRRAAVRRITPLLDQTAAQR